MPPSEFQIINQFFTHSGAARRDVVLGVGDDAALVRPPPGQTLALAVDTLVAGCHFPHGTDAALIGHKALAVNLSDLAAMGAQPAWATLSLALPSVEKNWLEAFSAGFAELASKWGVQLIGGDMVQGPLTVTVQIAGFVPPGEALRRGTARPGDRVYITGTLGDSAAGLRVVQGKLSATDTDRRFLVKRLERPSPRLAIGIAIRTFANSAIDISDGLAGDLGHIVKCSDIGARIELERLPYSSALCRTVPSEAERITLALSGGDDYELCFTVAPTNETALLTHAADIDCPLTCIGEITTAGSGLQWLHEGKEIDAGGGFDHFSGRG